MLWREDKCFLEHGKLPEDKEDDTWLEQMFELLKEGIVQEHLEHFHQQIPLCRFIKNLQTYQLPRLNLEKQVVPPDFVEEYWT